MSLQAFHIVFIMASIAMSLLVGVWGVLDFRRDANVTSLLIGVGFFVAGGVLIWYSSWFVRKLRVLKDSQ